MNQTLGVPEVWLGSFHPVIPYQGDINFAISFEAEADGSNFKLTGFTGIPMHLERFHEILLEHSWGWENNKIVPLK